MKGKIVVKINKFLDHKKSLLYILLIAFIIRLIWIVTVKTLPTSDFKLMYETGRIVSNGNFSAFYGHNYFALFPHDSITVLYFSLFFKFLGNPLFLIKFMNVIYETVSVYIVYLIVKNTYNDRVGKIGALLITLFPPFIMYCSETMAENMAIPLFLISVYLFIKYIDTLDSDCFTACLDVGHAKLCCEDPAAFVKALGKKRLGALHVHDVDGIRDLHTLPYFGMGNWDKFTKALAEIDYEGDFTYESGNFDFGKPKELYTCYEKLAVETGRFLINKINGYKKEVLL